MGSSQRIVGAFLVTASAGSLVLGSAGASAADTAPAVRKTGAVVEKAAGAGGTMSAPRPGTRIPRRSAGTIRATAADRESVTIGLPQTRDVPGTSTGRGTTVYPGAAPSTDFAVQATADGGIRALAVLKDASAPREQRYTIGLPEGARLVELTTGAVAAVSGDGTLLGAFGAPWAKDADGAPVRTEYSVEGNTLVQKVSVGRDTAFPVVADPKWLDEASKGAAAGLIGGCAGGSVAAGAGCLPGAVAGGVTGAVAGAIGSLFG